ncbi:MAG: ABC transporter substrate-binding protein [Bacteroidota bacterium]|jgi:NitT/TauT family transport system substrate-binding protein
MRRVLTVAAALFALNAGLGVAQAQTQTVRMAWCAKTLSSAVAPFALATKLGWFEKMGIKVEVVPLPGSTDCVKSVATKDMPFGLPSEEPIIIIRRQGVDIRYYYTAYQGNVYGIAVPAESPIKTAADLRGKKIGVTSMASAGVIVARALAAEAGMNPDKDIQILVAGEGAQTAALLRTNQIDALSQFDTQYAMVENAGMKLRRFEDASIRKFPSNGFIALAETLKEKRKEAVALAKGYAMGTLFAINNPEAGIRALWEVYPQTKPTGKDEATALRDDIKTLEARAENWKLEPVGAKRWGDNVLANHQGYLDWLLKQGVIKEKANASEFLFNDLLDEINDFDQAKIIAEAKAYKAK